MIQFLFGFYFNYKKISWELIFLHLCKLFNSVRFCIFIDACISILPILKNKSHFWDQKNLMLRRSVENWFCGSNLIKFGKRKQVKSVSAVFTANKARNCFIIQTGTYVKNWAKRNYYDIIIEHNKIIILILVQLSEHLFFM